MALISFFAASNLLPVAQSIDSPALSRRSLCGQLLGIKITTHGLATEVNCDFQHISNHDVRFSIQCS